jgi:hypothetical protein
MIEVLHNIVLQKDLKKILKLLPEGVLIYKRLGDTKVKLWNNELERMFKFSMPETLYLENNFSSNNFFTPNSIA